MVSITSRFQILLWEQARFYCGAQARFPGRLNSGALEGDRPLVGLAVAPIELGPSEWGAGR